MSKSLYVNKNGAVLSRQGQRLVIRANDRSILREIPVFDVSQVILVGNIQITGSALDLILQNNISTLFLTQHGRYKGRLVRDAGHFAQLRLKQYSLINDHEFRLQLATKFVKGKLWNMRINLLRRHRRGSVDLDKALGRIEMALDRLPLAKSTEEIMGIEGAASKEYFSGFRACLKQDMGFRKRQRRPPPDPVNALLSFGYTILHQYCDSAVRRVGLDPYLGFLHEVQDRKPSLSLDTMEEFRPLIVDSVVLGLINRLTLTVDDFERTDKGHRMHPASLARFVNALEERLDTSTGAINGDATSYRLAIEAQARQLARVILGKNRDAYTPVKWR